MKKLFVATAALGLVATGVLIAPVVWLLVMTVNEMRSEYRANRRSES